MKKSEAEEGERRKRRKKYAEKVEVTGQNREKEDGKK